jgi:hypothetical protein
VARHLIRKEPKVITSTTRRERHEINIRLEVTGEQVIADRDALTTKRPITPTVVQLSYRKQGGEWAKRALVYGTQVGSLLNGWAEYYERAEGGTDWWPAWLLAYLEQFDPSRDAKTG